MLALFKGKDVENIPFSFLRWLPEVQCRMSWWVQNLYRYVLHPLFPVVIACPHCTVYLQGTRPYLWEKGQKHLTVVLEPAQVLPPFSPPLLSAQG